MKRIIFTIFLFGAYLGVNAQSSSRIGIGLTYLLLNAPDAKVLMPRLSYEHQLTTKWAASISVGYLKRQTDYTIELLNNEPVSFPETRQRVALDGTLHFNLLKTALHTVGIGAGPSLWYQFDNITRNVEILGLQYIASSTITEKWRMGGNASLHYAIQVTPNSSLRATFQMAPLYQAGLNPNWGLSYFYNFR